MSGEINNLFPLRPPQSEGTQWHKKQLTEGLKFKTYFCVSQHHHSCEVAHLSQTHMYNLNRCNIVLHSKPVVVSLPRPRFPGGKGFFFIFLDINPVSGNMASIPATWHCRSSVKEKSFKNDSYPGNWKPVPCIVYQNWHHSCIWLKTVIWSYSQSLLLQSVGTLEQH